MENLEAVLLYHRQLGILGYDVPSEGKLAMKPDSLDVILRDIGDCTRCKLHKGRTHIVFGSGNPKADIMFIGEGPGEEEDKQGLPFVGRAGQLLTKIIESIHTRREDVYIANVVKCRPPKNRAPEEDEMTTCSQFLLRQIRAVAPKIIVALGAIATQSLLNTHEKISKLRGRFYDYYGIKLIPTYHPAFLLRNPDMKRFVWEDMKMVKKEYETHYR